MACSQSLVLGHLDFGRLAFVAGAVGGNTMDALAIPAEEATLGRSSTGQCSAVLKGLV